MLILNVFSYMKHGWSNDMKSFLLPILTLFVFACANSRADDLSELIDAAAASGEKKIVLENRTYFQA